MQFEAIGTTWEITSPQSLDDVAPLVRARIAEFDATYSRFLPDSLVSTMGRTPGSYTLPAGARDLFDFYWQLYKITDGQVTPLIGSTLEQAGYDAAYSLKPGTLTPPPSWHEGLAYNFPTLTIKQPVVIDLGAAGKGYLVDIVAELLKAHDIPDFSINAGGDIVVHGNKREVGLEHPDDPMLAIGIIHIQNQALCGSAGSRRAWAGFHHTIHPLTLTSPKNYQAIWVKAATGMLADGLTTALYFTDPAQLQQKYQFEYAMIQGEEVIASPGFGATFFRGDE